MERTQKKALSFLIVSLLLGWLVGGDVFLAAAAESPAPQALKKVVIGYSAISTSQAPAWVAHEAGIFRKYGLDVQLIFVESGSRTVQTLISGDVVAAQVAGSSVMQSNIQGSGVVLIAGIMNTMDYKLIVSRDITRPDQLKGKVVAVSRIGSSSDFATRYALEKYGLIPDKDVTILQIGSQPARFSALETGKIHGVMIAVPLTAKAAKMGYNTLADLQMLGLEYQHTGLAVTQNMIKTQPELVRNVLKAFVEAIYYMKTHRKEAIAILGKYLKTDDPEALVEAYEATVLTLIPEKPYPTLKGIQIMLREMGIKDPAARAARPEQFVDMTLMKELDSTGFIDRLYKSTAVAKAAPRAESAPAPAPAKEKAAPAESKVKAVASVEEKAKPTAKQVPSPAEKPALPKAASTVKPAAQEYIIKQGDSLSKLAERFYNSMNKWEKIYEANRDSVKNPNYVFIGQKIVIPPDEQAN
ncbi:MAG: ABC transporter substrate-binding protein [Deltaproteobacteria bacterium]|nr:ABC transporter substrate-binding protein [Deltaproteobacteria bacterium]MDZ4345084.1 ABC transporter substrate-binding protein [Candidatus Binatia bacterium]